MHSSRLRNFICCLFLMPLLVFAEETETTPDGITWTFDVWNGEAVIRRMAPRDYAGSLVIPASLGDFPVTSIGEDAFNSYYQLTQVTIPSSVTNIDAYAFSFCKAMTSLIISDGVVNIGECAFEGCYDLTSVVIPSSVKNIGKLAFGYCEVLKSLTISDGVVNVGDRAFEGCGALTSVVIPSSVTSIGASAFWCCEAMTSISIPASVISVGECALDDCYELNTIYVSRGDGARVRELLESSGFYSEEVIFFEAVDDGGPYVETTPDGVTWTYSVKGGMATIGMGGLAIAERATGSLEIPARLGNRPVSRIEGGAFSNCADLVSIGIPPGVTTVGDAAFADCPALRTIYVPNGGTDRARQMLSRSGLDVKAVAFREALEDGGPYTETTPDGITWTFTVSGGEATIGEEYGESAIAYDTYGSIEIPERLGNCLVVNIGDYAFYWCEYLTRVMIPPSVERIGSYAFYGCEDLTSVRIPGSVVDIGDYAFYCCHGLGSIEFPPSVTQIGECAFCGCEGLTSVKIPSGLTSIGDLAFHSCLSLAEFSVDEGNSFFSAEDGILYSENKTVLVQCPPQKQGEVKIPQGVTILADRAFAHCRNLTSLLIPSSVKEIGYEALNSNQRPDSRGEDPDGVEVYHSRGMSVIEVDEDNPFFSSYEGVLYNKGMTVLLQCPIGRSAAVTIPGSVTNIESSAFAYCTELSSVTIPSCVRNIGRSAFLACCGLSFVEIPSGVTGIEDSTFAGCAGLASITIPLSVTNIEDRAFYGCSGLTSLIVPSGVINIGRSAFANCGMQSVSIPESVTSIGDWAFEACRGLLAISVHEENKNYASIDGVLYNKDRTVLIQCPAGRQGEMAIPSGVTNIGGHAFDSCGRLTSVTISFGVTNISDYAFSSCRGLTSVTIPLSVTSIGRAFVACRTLKTVYVSYGDAERVRSLLSKSGLTMSGLEILEMLADGGPYAETTADGISWKFMVKDGKATIDACSFADPTIPMMSVEAIEIPVRLGNCPVAGIADGVFRDCEGLVSVAIPSGVMSVGESAFENCASLRVVYVGSGDTERIRELLSNSGLDMDELQILERLEDGGPYTETTADGICWTFRVVGGNAILGTGSSSGRAISKDIVGSVEIPSQLGNCPVMTIGHYAFRGCSGLTSVTIPLSVMTIGDYAFDGCSKLTSVLIPSNVISIGTCAFMNCHGLHSIVIPLGVRSLGDNVFNNCGWLSSVKISSSVSSIGENAFLNCGSLAEILVDEGNPVYSSIDGVLYDMSEASLMKCPACHQGTVVIPPGVVRIADWAFFGCEELAAVTIPPSVKSIGGQAFDSCGLTSVEIPSGVEEIEYAAFGSCDTLVSILVDEGNMAYSSHDGILYNKTKTALVQCPAGKSGALTIPTGVESVCVYAFGGCGKLTSVVIPPSVMSIGDGAFVDCSRLKDVTIPLGVERIGGQAFYWCTGLRSITLPSSLRSVEEWAFDGCSGLNVVYVSNGDTARIRELLMNSGGFRDGVQFLEALEDGGPYTEKMAGGTDLAFVVKDGMAIVGTGNDSDPAVPAATTGILEIPERLGNCLVTGIAEGAFSNCTGLVSVVIPSSITNIGNNAFASCSDLGSVVVRPLDGQTSLEVTIPPGLDASKVTAEVSMEVEKVALHGANLKVVSCGADITELLDVPLADADGLLDLSRVTVKESVVKEVLDPQKGAVIVLNATDPVLTTAPTREGLFYFFREGVTLDEMWVRSIKIGDGKPWTPEIYIKGGGSAFYSMGVDARGSF